MLPADTWVFTALVVRPDEARLYLADGNTLTVAVNVIAHAAEEFDGVTNIGRDPNSGRYFDGWIDDVRVYRGALSADDIADLYARAFLHHRALV